MAKQDRWPSNAELDLEARQKAGFLQPAQVNEVVSVNAPYAVEDNDTSAYRGVSPEYMTYAEETNKPFLSEDGPEQQAEEDAKVSQNIVRSTTRKHKAAKTGGVTDELVYSATSGEDYTPEDVEDEDEDEDDDENDDDDSKEKVVKPKKEKRHVPTQRHEHPAPVA